MRVAFFIICADAHPAYARGRAPGPYGPGSSFGAVLRTAKCRVRIMRDFRLAWVFMIDLLFGYARHKDVVCLYGARGPEDRAK
jgi:hypothetical protein